MMQMEWLATVSGLARRLTRWCPWAHAYPYGSACSTHATDETCKFRNLHHRECAA